jgi:transposase
MVRWLGWASRWAATPGRCADRGNRAEIDGGTRLGSSTDDQQRIAELEREVLDLRHPNEILKSASAFFAAELDHPQPR